MSEPLPVIVDLMPRDPSPWPPYSPRFLIAFAISSMPRKYRGRFFGENSEPVTAVVEALRRGGYKIVPMERGDYQR